MRDVLVSTMITVVMLAAILPGLLLARDEVKIDLNAASATQLEELPGIGPALAKRIVEFRKENGPFKKIEDLMNVRGIGEKKFLNLKDKITVKASGGKTGVK
jgi:competence ComEA-like helix-hairpin-helix protein